MAFDWGFPGVRAAGRGSSPRRRRPIARPHHTSQRGRPMHHRPGSGRRIPVHAVLRAASLAAGAALLVWGLSGCGGGDADAASASSGTLAHTATLEAPMSAAAAPPVFPLTLYAH